MDPTLESLLRGWGGQAVVMRHDAEADAWIFIALHDSTLGRPTGGTRMKVYERPADGLLDAQRLAEGMTSKWAVLGLPKGGGKAVLALSRELQAEERQALLRRYGDLIASLQGAFATGEDLGTTPEDMAVIGSRTRYVHGVSDSGGEVEDPGPFTARGVVGGIRAALEHLDGSGEVEGKRFLIQGVGDVGEPVARELAAGGARLLLADMDGLKVQALADDLGAEVVEPAAVVGTECDVFAPCAVGAVLNAETISRLRCRAVAGSANNQLRTADDARRLHERGILYAPDYVINGGGALAFGLMDQGLTDREELMRRVDAVGVALAEIFREAGEAQESPVAAAERRVRRTLEKARSLA